MKDFGDKVIFPARSMSVAWSRLDYTHELRRDQIDRGMEGDKMDWKIFIIGCLVIVIGIFVLWFALHRIAKAEKIEMRGLSDKESRAISVLMSHGWQVVNGPHLEDWDNGQTVEVDDHHEDIEVRADIAIIKIDL